ncbi:MAG: hypothetical protein QM278_09350 [Pseudomonadota bacterium]|nr:hypothetical protein [Pseudomonadota bacterium]
MENDFGTSVRPSFEDIEERFRQWRGHRKRGKSIPEDLWKGAVSSCAGHTLSKVSRALHLNHATLKKRFLAARSAHIPGSVTPSDFLALDLRAALPEGHKAAAPRSVIKNGSMLANL